MLITLDAVTVGRGVSASVPALTLSAAPGAPTVLAVETAERPMLVSLLLGGRLRPDSGRVLVDGLEDADELRRRTALVDTPVVAEPTAGLGLGGVLAEELAFAGRASTRRAVRAFIARHGLEEYADVPMRALPPTSRVRLFSELALLRVGVDALVVTSPERHGGDPAEWFALLAEIASRGKTVIVVTDATTARALVGLGAVDASVPPPAPVQGIVAEAAPAASTSSTRLAIEGEDL
jgi:ABC-2 type transport system ATP-binding protein